MVKRIVNNPLVIMAYIDEGGNFLLLCQEDGSFLSETSDTYCREVVPATGPSDLR